MGLARRGDRVRHPVPRPEGLRDFEGRWVAVKDGEVIAQAENSRSLVYEVHKLGPRGKGAVAQYVAKPSNSSMVGVG